MTDCPSLDPLPPLNLILIWEAGNDPSLKIEFLFLPNNDKVESGMIHYQKEWNYPRTFLASDGNIVGISYNKIWVMDLKNNFRLTKTGEIPLVKSGISRIEKFQKPNLKSSEIENLKL